MMRIRMPGSSSYSLLRMVILVTSKRRYVSARRTALVKKSIVLRVIIISARDAMSWLLSNHCLFCID